MSDATCFLFQERPRSFALKSNDSAIIFRCSNDDEIAASRCIVQFCHWKDVSENDYRQLTPLPIYGCLGLINSGEDIFLCIITGCSETAVIRRGESANKILAVEFYCINNSKWDNGMVGGYEFDDNLETSIETEPEQLCSSLQRLLTDGTFYFSADCDLTTKLQNRSLNADYCIDTFDESFMWNKFMMSELLTFRSHLSEKLRKALDACHFLVNLHFQKDLTRDYCYPRVCGNAAMCTNDIQKSAYPGGTRYNSRGIDDEGNVANFVETETLLQTSTFCFSFCQIRGSVPIFWEQVGIQLLGQKIQIPRSMEATQPAFKKHFEALVGSYGPVHVVNLLGSKGGERALSERYEQHLQNLGDLGKQTKYTTFDFNAEVKIGGYENANMIRGIVGQDVEVYAFYLEEDKVILKQTGILRANCLDCLDRTNLVQGIFSQMAIEGFFTQRNMRAGVEFWKRHNILWADNGDALSRIYAGTNALKTSYTRKGKSTFVGALSDVTKVPPTRLGLWLTLQSVGRLYINQFLDKGRLINQKPVQLFDPINDYVNQKLLERSSEYLSTSRIEIYAGTFNLNGRISHESLDPWLHPDSSRLLIRVLTVDCPMKADLVAIGFQEIVELTAQQIVNADPAKREFWEQRVLDTLNKGRNEYVFLRSGQLVGAALFLFAKASSLSAIRNVECSVRKTGLKGMSGNKGGVSIRLDYENTRICFITAHFAAGYANVVERNNDYKTIGNGLKFQRGRTILDHDAIIWLGDFNYRITLGNDDVRYYINKGDVGILYENDQMNGNKAFEEYKEAQVTFLPTYKFDNGTDDYDTSEKQRIPSWTDRILSLGSILQQTAYNSAPLRFSDHRPVYALFDATITKVDEEIREHLAKELYEMQKTNTLEHSKKSSPLIGFGGDRMRSVCGISVVVLSFKPALPPKPKFIPRYPNLSEVATGINSTKGNTIDDEANDLSQGRPHPPPKHSATIKECGALRAPDLLPRPHTIDKQARIESAEKDLRAPGRRSAPPLPSRIGRSNEKLEGKLKHEADLD